MTSNSESKESKFFQKAISVFLSALLVVAFIPAVAFADVSDNAGYASSQEDGGYKVDISGSTVIGEDNSGAGVGANTDNSQNNSADLVGNEPNNEPNSESSGTTDSTEGSAVVQSQGGQGQSEDAMSSWRFADGQLETVYADEDNGIEMYSLRAGNGSPVAKGIDVSSWQGNIDWNTVKNSGQVDFVIIRCGWGNNDSSQNDAYWLRNASECKRLGIPFGVYIYSYACNTSYAVSEADHVLAQLNAAGLSPSQVAYPIYLDLEQQSKSNNRPCGIDNWNNEVLLSNGDLANIAQAFCNRIASAGYTPGIYANLNWWNNYLTSSVFDNYERWVAQYNSSCWYEGNYSLWQYASDGTVPGISGYVDMNYFYGKAGSVSDKYTTPNKPYKQTIPDGDYYITSSLNNYSVLDITDGSKANGANLQLYESNKSAAQQFRITRDSKTGFYSIKNLNSGLELGLKKMRIGYDSNVAQYNIGENDNSQKWIIEENENSSYIIKSAANPDYVLDVKDASSSNGANLQVYISNGSKAQRFKFSNTAINVQAGAEVPESEMYSIASKIDSSKVLDITDGSTANGALLQLYSSNGTKAQVFKLKKASKGFYYIVNEKSGKVLDVRGGGLAVGAIVQQYSLSEGSDNQLWALRKNSNDSYTIIAKVNGLALGVQNGSAKDGSAIQLYNPNESNTQKFILKKTELPKRTVSDGTYVIESSINQNYALDVSSGSMNDKANIQLYSKNQTPAQSFVFSYDEKTGYYSIVNLKSGKAIDATDGKAGNGINVQQYDSNGTLAQRWIIENQYDGLYVIKSALDPEYVLDVSNGRASNGNNIQLYKANGTAAQKFKLTDAVIKRTVSDGTYVIESSINQNYALDVSSGSMNDKANIQLYSKNQTPAQSFVFSYDEKTGYYSIVNLKSGKAIDATDGKAGNGINVQQYDSNGTLAQRWIIENQYDGLYVIKSALDPEYVLDVSNGRASNGNNIQLYKANGTAAQKFKL